MRGARPFRRVLIVEDDPPRRARRWCVASALRSRTDSRSVDVSRGDRRTARCERRRSRIRSRLARHSFARRSSGATIAEEATKQCYPLPRIVALERRGDGARSVQVGGARHRPISREAAFTLDDLIAIYRKRPTRTRKARADRSRVRGTSRPTRHPRRCVRRSMVAEALARSNCWKSQRGRGKLLRVTLSRQAIQKSICRNDSVVGACNQSCVATIVSVVSAHAW